MLSMLWVNTYGCAEQYQCAMELFLLSMLSKAFYVIIRPGISAPGHGIKEVYGLNTSDKSFLFRLMSTVKLMAEK